MPKSRYEFWSSMKQKLDPKAWGVEDSGRMIQRNEKKHSLQLQIQLGVRNVQSWSRAKTPKPARKGMWRPTSSAAVPVVREESFNGDTRVPGYAEGRSEYLIYPEGPSTQYLRALVPKAINGMVFGTRVLKYWVLGPSWYEVSWTKYYTFHGFRKRKLKYWVFGPSKHAWQLKEADLDL